MGPQNARGAVNAAGTGGLSRGGRSDALEGADEEGLHLVRDLALAVDVAGVGPVVAERFVLADGAVADVEDAAGIAAGGAGLGGDGIADVADGLAEDDEHLILDAILLAVGVGAEPLVTQAVVAVEAVGGGALGVGDGVVVLGLDGGGGLGLDGGHAGGGAAADEQGAGEGGGGTQGGERAVHSRTSSYLKRTSTRP
jgi:hypothetical protein